MKNKRNKFIIALMLFNLYSFFFLDQKSSASDDIVIKADVVMALSHINNVPCKIKLIAWTYSGDIYFLTENLDVTRKTKIPELTIRNILQISNRLLILADKNKKDAQVESVIIQYDIAEDKETHRWWNPKYYIWSISAHGETAVAMSSEGDMLECGEQGFQAITKYPRKSHYLFAGSGDPIICTASNLTKLQWKLPFCNRDGGYKWQRDGQWENIAPPFLCNNYLIEKNKTLKNETAIINIADISTGSKIAEHKVKSISNLNCVEPNIIYSSKSSIFVRELPDFKQINKVDTKSKTINSVTKAGNSIYYIDENRVVRRRNL